MKNKKRYIKKIDYVTLFMHFIAVLLLMFLSAGALRQNNLTMLELRDSVFKADESGEGLDQALILLRNHVTTHMNAKLPKLGEEKAIQLKYSYERAVSLEQKRFQEEIAALSLRARNNCASIKTEISKVECEQKYIKDNPVSPLKDIYPEMYSIEFVSPRWSFDLAGWLILTAVLLGLLLIGRIAALYLAVKYIKSNFK